MPTYKINYSGGKARVINVNKLPNKTVLQSLDRVYLGQPFVNVVSKFQDTRGLDTVYLGQPFYGHTDAIAIPSSRISTTNHPDVDNWLNTVALNGGSASSSTIAALNTFCNSIDAAGLRNKFYRLNLFCGNNLASCLVPLFGRPTPSGPEYGNGVDENVGFVESDYVETGANGGLKGNGSTKHIRPRLIVSRATGNESVGCYVTQEATVSNPTGTYYLIGSHFPSNNNRSLGIAYYSNQYNIEDGTLGISPNGTWSTSLGQATGFRCASSNGLSSRKMYLNGSVIWSNTNTTTASINAISPYLFARSDSGNGYGLGNQRMAGYFIGTSMTDTDMVNLNNAMQTFQTALNRNV